MRQFIQLALIGFLGPGLAAPDLARADFAQPYNPASGDFVVSDTQGDPTQRVADNFTLSQTFNPAIHSLYITWWGGFNVDNAPGILQTLDFRLQISPNNANDLPTINPIASFNTSAEVTGVDVIDPAGAYDAYRYSALVNGANTLLAGQQYWLSIVDIDPLSTSASIGGPWHWAATSTSDNYAVRNNDVAPWQLGGTTSRAFSISVVGIPEPSASMLLLAGIPALWKRRRKTSKQEL